MSNFWLFLQVAVWAIGFGVHLTNLHDAVKDFWEHNRWIQGDNVTNNRLVLTRASAVIQCLGLVIMGFGVTVSFLLPSGQPLIYSFRFVTGSLLTIISIISRIIRRKQAYSFRVTDEGAIDEKGEIPGGETFEIPTERRRP